MTATADTRTELSAAELKAVFRRHPAGVAVITLRGPRGPVGFTATSVFSISAEPPLLGFSVAGTSSSLPAVRAVSSLVVNFLAEDQVDVADRFARQNIDRFAGVDWVSLPTGEPVLGGTAAWVRGRVEQRTPAADSLLVTVRALLADRTPDASPLVYHDRSYHRLSEHHGLT